LQFSLRASNVYYRSNVRYIVGIVYYIILDNLSMGLTARANERERTSGYRSLARAAGSLGEKGACDEVDDA
jgi:hypothetical protein